MSVSFTISSYFTLRIRAKQPDPGEMNLQVVKNDV